MGLTRKRQRELDRLKGRAEELWDDQKEVLEHATQVVRDARRQAVNFAREEVPPRVRETLEEKVKPVVTSGVSATRHVASGAKEKILDEVFPAVSSALGSALAVLEVAKDPRVREVVKKVSAASSEASARAAKLGTKLGTKVGTKVGLVKPKPTPGAGRYILIGVAVVALATLAYAAYQTLRADDELWVEDEELPEQESAQPVDDTV